MAHGRPEGDARALLDASEDDGEVFGEVDATAAVGLLGIPRDPIHQ